MSSSKEKKRDYTSDSSFDAMEHIRQTKTKSKSEPKKSKSVEEKMVDSSGQKVMTSFTTKIFTTSTERLSALLKDMNKHQECMAMRLDVHYRE